MVHNASLFLALRYLRPKRSFVSIITTISVLGVAVGVLMMVVVRAVMLGFEADFRETLMGAEPHVLITQQQQQNAEGADQSKGIKSWQQVLTEARQQPSVTSAAPFAGGVLYMANGDWQTGAPILGLSREESAPHLQKLARHLMVGSLDLQDSSIVLSDRSAEEIGVQVGDEISVYAAQNVNAAVRDYGKANDEKDKAKRQAMLDAIRLHAQKLKVAGIIRSSTGGYYAYVSLATGQQLLRLEEKVSGIAVELSDPQLAKGYAQTLGTHLPGWKFQLWTDSGEARLAAMQNEQTMMRLVLSIIALVAAFSVMNTTITITTQKRREIGMLASIGARQGQVIMVFVYQSLMVGFIGTALGLGGSLLVLWLRNDLRQILTTLTGGQVHAVEGVFLSTIPAHIQPWDIGMTCLFSLLLCLFAGLIPAWFAARVDPAVALRD